MTGAFVPPHSSSRRAALIEQLIVALTSPDEPPLLMQTRAPDDPTIALLDAWATVGDVLGFYSDRIADEGYLSTAIQPGSILALASLVGYQPAPSLAAQVHLAYTLAPDSTDGAVQFSPGLLFQSVPGPGQQPQTFESNAKLLARPSWNVLKVKSGQPVQSTATSLVVNGTAAKLAPNSVILLESGTTPNPVAVESATVDYTAKVTNVTLQPATVQPVMVHKAKIAAMSTPDQPPDNTTKALDGVVKAELKVDAAKATPRSAHKHPTPGSVFSAGSDSVPRLLSALQPSIASTLYAALGSTTIGSAPVTGASVMAVAAAPFGAAAPPQPVFNASGQRAGSRDWPLGDTFTLQFSVTAADFLRLHETALSALRRQAHPVRAGVLQRVFGPRGQVPMTEFPVIDVQCSVATYTSQATITVDAGHWPPPQAAPVPASFGALTLATNPNRTVELKYAGFAPPSTASAPPPSTPELTVQFGLDANTDGVTLNFTAGPNQGELIWDPAVNTVFNGQVGNAQVTIIRSTPTDAPASITLSIATPLPPADPSVLQLDGNYPGITSGSPVLIHQAETHISAATVAMVQSADTVAASGFGITGKVTQLKLDKAWLDAGAVLQSALRPVTVYAQPTALSLQPAPVTDDVAGQSIDLGELVDGMDPGRLIAVTGTRTDLPGATVPGGEIATVASVSTSADAGGTPYSTLNLARPLAYSYQRATVQVYGNVVSAHQGATIKQMLGSGQPAQAPQSFTLTAGPLLADPAKSASGYRSALTVTVDGVGYAQVNRVDGGTPARSFVTGTNASGQTTIVFPSPLPPGTGNITASYRTGDGSQGNLQANQITQLLTRPASLSSVTNPLPATGGSGGDDKESVRAAAPSGLSSLGRVVTISDYAGLAGSFAGVGKSSAALTAAGVVVTIAGTDPAPLDPNGSLCSGVATAIAAVADPNVPVHVLPADVYLIALTANVVRDPTVSWDTTVAAVQAGLQAGFGYSRQNLGQDVAVSNLLAAAHGAPGVLSVTITGLALVPATASATALSTTLPGLLANPVPAVATLAAVPSQWQLPSTPGAPTPAAVAYFSATAPGTLILSEQKS